MREQRDADDLEGTPVPVSGLDPEPSTTGDAGPERGGQRRFLQPKRLAGLIHGLDGPRQVRGGHLRLRVRLSEDALSRLVEEDEGSRCVDHEHRRCQVGGEVLRQDQGDVSLRRRPPAPSRRDCTHRGSEPAPLSSDVEASGFLVGPAVFKTDERATSSLAGSIPVRLRVKRSRGAIRGAQGGSTISPQLLAGVFVLRSQERLHLSVEALGRLDVDHMANPRDEHKPRSTGSPNAAPPIRAVVRARLLAAQNQGRNAMRAGRRGDRLRRTPAAPPWWLRDGGRRRSIQPHGRSPEVHPSRRTSRRAPRPTDRASAPYFAASVGAAARRPRRKASPPSLRTPTQGSSDRTTSGCRR